MNNFAPVPKVAAAGLSAAIVTLIVFAAKSFGYPIPAEVAAAAVTVVSSVAGYWAPRS